MQSTKDGKNSLAVQADCGDLVLFNLFSEGFIQKFTKIESLKLSAWLKQIFGFRIICYSTRFQTLTTHSLQDSCLCSPVALHLTFSARLHLLVTVNQNVHYLMNINIDSASLASLNWSGLLLIYSMSAWGFTCISWSQALGIVVSLVWVLQLGYVLSTCCNLSLTRISNSVPTKLFEQRLNNFSEPSKVQITHYEKSGFKIIFRDVEGAGFQQEWALTLHFWSRGRFSMKIRKIKTLEAWLEQDLPQSGYLI